MIRIPVWRIVRKCFNKDLTCRYKDGDITNLKRENIELIRKPNKLFIYPSKLTKVVGNP